MPAQTFRASSFLPRAGSSPSLLTPLRRHSEHPFAKLSLPLCPTIEVISAVRLTDKADHSVGTMMAVRTHSSVSLLSLSSPMRARAYPEIRDVGSFDRRSLDGHTAVDVQFHGSNLMLVNNLGQVFRHALLNDEDP